LLEQQLATRNDSERAAELTDAEAAQRLAQYGENTLAEHRVGVLERLARFFWGPIPWMIEIAAVLSAVLSHWGDLAIILVMLAVNAGVGFWQEFKADTAIELLKQRLALKARVERNGECTHVPARLLVPAISSASSLVPLSLPMRSSWMEPISVSTSRH
jgi:H+-transporting ATPase